MCSKGNCEVQGVYPVDFLEDDPGRHQEVAAAYHASLRQGTGDTREVFFLPTGKQVQLKNLVHVLLRFVPGEPQQKILALVHPQDTKTVVAVYLKGSWWCIEDILRTSDPARKGLLKVQSFGERIVLFILNVVVFGRLERSVKEDDMFFLPHSAREQAKIPWRGGAAIGFYSTKMKEGGHEKPREHRVFPVVSKCSSLSLLLSRIAALKKIRRADGRDAGQSPFKDKKEKGEGSDSQPDMVHRTLKLRGPLLAPQGPGGSTTFINSHKNGSQMVSTQGPSLFLGASRSLAAQATQAQ
ncbi:protein FAM169B-like [Perognathus longimembris pacificus]|uniref:protein FAM169B-like n=1 Tax=Perognathus longimembris pacificus TaxID=214514 RepID=UPI00201A193A|nr:protein FAM169B-like [Perognathus longimembris pacificus]